MPTSAIQLQHQISHIRATVDDPLPRELTMSLQAVYGKAMARRRPVGGGCQAGLGAGRLEVPGAQQAQRLAAPNVRVRGCHMLNDLLLRQTATYTLS